MAFRSLTRISAALCFVLCLGLLGAPSVFTFVFGLDPSVAGEVMARRSGVLFAPLGLVLWAVQDLPPNALRRDLARAALVLMAGLATLGLIEWGFGRVGAGIFLAVSVESLLAILFARFAFSRI